MRSKRLSAFVLSAFLLFPFSACSSAPPADFKSETNPTRHFLIDRIDQDRMLDTIQTLSSQDYAGRLPGTEGNEKSITYITGRFKNLSLSSPQGLTDYAQPFALKTLLTQAPSELAILDHKGFPQETFDDISEFKVLSYLKMLKIDGEAEGEMALIDDFSNLTLFKKDDYKEKILLFDESLIEFTGSIPAFMTRYKHIIGEASGWIFNWDIRSQGYFPVSKFAADESPFCNEDGPMAFIVGEDVFEALKSASREGLRSRMSSHVNFEETNTANLVGFMPGTDPERTLILSAHFDHVGDNMNGTYNPGALDNASGIALLLETAEILATGHQPKDNIAFIAFNGEEEGLYGSRHYVAHPVFPLQNTTLVNLDMLGSKNILTLFIASKDAALTEALSACFEEMDIPWEPSETTASDHGPFMEKRIPAALLIDEDMEYIHRPVDTIDNTINPKRLVQIEKALLLFIDRNAY